MILLLFFILTANAAIPEGTWKGTISPQAYCFMDVGAETYDGVINPLNKRVAVTIGNKSYSLRHPYSISTEGRIIVNETQLEGILPTETGSFAVQLTVERLQGGDLPTYLRVMEDDWKSNFREVVECSNFRRVYP